MKFTWDENKNQLNIRKHGIDFSSAAYVFSDPFALSIPDDDHSETEERWLLLGKSLNEQMLLSCSYLSIMMTRLDCSLRVIVLVIMECYSVITRMIMEKSFRPRKPKVGASRRHKNHENL